MTIKFSSAVSGAALTCLLLPAISVAQNADESTQDRVIPISERANPDVDPTPIVEGSFELRPELVFTAGSQSNALASDLNEVEDSFVGFKPSLRVDSNWQRHGLGGAVVIDHREYADLDSESRTDLKVKLRGRLDLGENTSFTVKIKGADQTEDRLALSNVAGSIEPNEYTSARGALGFEHQAGALQLQGDVGLATYDYDDTELAGDLFQDQDFRDRDELSASGRLGYALNDSNVVYAKGTVVQADYAEPNIFNATNRDHTGTVLLVGSEFQVGQSLSGDIGVGYQYYTYDDVIFEDISDVAFAGHVDWQITPRTTLGAEAERSVIDPGIALSNAAIATEASVRLEQGLTSRLSLTGEAGFGQYAFETIERDDDRVNLNVGANWKINQSVWLEGSYEVIDHQSDVQPFTDNRALVKMRIFP
ncbi:MAG: outer membrane beta-barrel protein [Pseudomonadota bacterium]